MEEVWVYLVSRAGAAWLRGGRWVAGGWMKALVGILGSLVVVDDGIAACG